MLILCFHKVTFPVPPVFPPAWMPVNAIKLVHFIPFVLVTGIKISFITKEKRKGDREVWFLTLFGNALIYTFIVSYKNNQFSAKTQYW